MKRTILVFCSLLFPALLPGQQRLERRELTIPMRDGVKLHAVALVPAEAAEPLPVLLIRTPFGADREFRSDTLPVRYRELAGDGYIFVTEDIRGRGKSEGTFVTTRAQKDPRSPPGINESTDAYDTIDWLVKNLANNNGRVGVIGISYRGWLAALAGVDPHPALKAISPQAPMADTWLGDDFFHHGAFRQTQGAAFVAWIESGTGLEIPDADQYDFYLRFPTVDSLASAIGVKGIGSWDGFVKHPSWDSYWQSMALQNVFTRPAVPVLLVGAWWDAEDILGPQLVYRTVEKHDRNRWNRLVMGPWFHGEWGGPGADSVGPMAVGNTVEYFRKNIQRPWLAHYLHGKGTGRFPEAWAFESGGNRWRTFETWPPRNGRARRIYLGPGGKLSIDRPAAEQTDYDAFVSDPANPVPFAPRPITDEGWARWMMQDQRFIGERPDVLSWISDPLEDDLVIAGDVTARLFASTTGTDADWVVKLIDVFPDSANPAGGYELMVNGEILRGRYWKSWTDPGPIPANTVESFTIDLHQQLYRFRKGHRMMVQVQSTWFPLYDRNPQTFVPNIFHAVPSDFRPQEHRIWHNARYPSHLVFTEIEN